VRRGTRPNPRTTATTGATLSPIPIDAIRDMRDPLYYPEALAAVGTKFARVKRIAGV
jgi:hypothetical protein